MSELWCPWAVRRDGPARKQGYTGGVAGVPPNLWQAAPKRGAIIHSADGYWPGIYEVLDGPRNASWHFTVGYDRVEQHYALNANCWHGNDTDDDQAVRGNIDLIGVEVLGRPGEAPTEYQLQSIVNLQLWSAEQMLGPLPRFCRWPDQNGWTLAEHRELGNTATLCPSGRIPWPEVMRRLAPVAPPPAPPTPTRVITGIRQEFHSGDRVRITLNYSDNSEQVVDA